MDRPANRERKDQGVPKVQLAVKAHRDIRAQSARLVSQVRLDRLGRSDRRVKSDPLDRKVKTGDLDCQGHRDCRVGLGRKAPKDKLALRDFRVNEVSLDCRASKEIRATMAKTGRWAIVEQPEMLDHREVRARLVHRGKSASKDQPVFREIPDCPERKAIVARPDQLGQPV